MKTFLSRYCLFWQVCWRNPWWYVALAFFVFGPVFASGRFPPWGVIYVPAMLVFVSVMAVLLQMQHSAEKS